MLPGQPHHPKDAVLPAPLAHDLARSEVVVPCSTSVIERIAADDPAAWLVEHGILRRHRSQPAPAYLQIRDLLPQGGHDRLTASPPPVAPARPPDRPGARLWPGCLRLPV
jgi:hypothetical protein